MAQMMAASPFATRALAIAGSALLHAGVLLTAAGHAAPAAANGSDIGPLVSIAEQIPPAPTIDVDEPLPLAHVAVPSFPTHTHPYPVPFDHDAHPHDAALVHIPRSPLPDAQPKINGADTRPIGPAVTDAPLRFVLPPITTSGVPGVGTNAGVDHDHAGPGEAEPVVPERSVSVPARAIHVKTPVYPAAALAHEVEGRVLLEIVVDTAGAVLSARVLTPGGSGFDDAALVAIRQYRFSPALREGRPVRVRMQVPVVFQLP